MTALGWLAAALAAVAALFLAYGYIMFRRKYLSDRPEAFDSKIASYRKADAANPPGDAKALFVGSSVMEFWKTIEHDLAPLPVLNRGIAGSKIVQWPYYTDRLVIPYRPSAVALYAGSNDMHGKKCKSPQQILDAFISFEKNVHEVIPETPVIFLSILPSPNKARWSNWEMIKTANRLIEEYTRQNANLGFIDATDAFLRDGRPMPELFLSDQVHLSPKGYQAWTGIVKPCLAGFIAIDNSSCDIPRLTLHA